MDTTRRSFLKGLLSGVAATTAAVVVPKIFVPEPEVVRRFWVVNVDFRTGGLVPVPGEPGAFVDPATGAEVRLSDFRESDKYDTIVIGGEQGCDYDAGRPVMQTYPRRYEPIEGHPGMFRETKTGALYRAPHFKPDPHVQRASEMFKVPYEDVTPAMRLAAKRANFGDSAGVSYPLIKNRGKCPSSDLTFNVPMTWKL